MFTYIAYTFITDSSTWLLRMLYANEYYFNLVAPSSPD